jgi:hypothetical protein
MKIERILIEKLLVLCVQSTCEGSTAKQASTPNQNSCAFISKKYQQESKILRMKNL